MSARQFISTLKMLIKFILKISDLCLEQYKLGIVRSTKYYGRFIIFNQIHGSFELSDLLWTR